MAKMYPLDVRLVICGAAALVFLGCGEETTPDSPVQKTEQSESVAPLGRVAEVGEIDEAEVETDPAEALRKDLGANEKAIIEVRGDRVISAGLTDSGVTSLEPLKDSELEILQIRGLNDITDLSPLNGVPLEYLDAAFTPVKDLAPLKGMPLKQLDLSFTRVEDLFPLAGMQNLEVLRLGRSRVKDLSPLAGLKKLKVLDLRQTPVEDLSPLKGLPLRELYLEKTEVTDLTPLQGLPLQTLYLSHTPVRDLSPLSGMQLNQLNLVGTSVDSITALKDTRLGTLWLTNTEVTSLEPLEGKTLVSLDIANTKISDLSPLSEMTSLQRLNIIDSHVTDLTPLANLSLNRLLFTPKNVEKGMDVVANMRSLKELDVTFREPKRLTPQQFWQQYRQGLFGPPKN